MVEDILFVIGASLIGLTWLTLHYVTKWKSSGTLTREDENLMDELYDTARRLDDRVNSIERIITADNPNWRN
jgi:phage shock protein B